MSQVTQVTQVTQANTTPSTVMSDLSGISNEEYFKLYNALNSFIVSPNKGNIEWPYLIKKDDGLWKQGNPLSSFEFICKVSRHLYGKDNSNNERDKFQFKMDNIIKQNEKKYGKYIGLDDWSVYFTDDQLHNYINLCLQTYLNDNKLIN